MLVVSLVLATLAALLHVYIVVMESVSSPCRAHLVGPSMLVTPGEGPATWTRPDAAAT